MLSTIAALADVSLAAVREKALAYGFYSGSPRRFWEAVEILCQDFHLSALCPIVSAHLVVVGHKPNSSDLSGRGTVLVTYTGTTMTHIMPYEDGKIVDPGDLVEYDGLEDFVKKNPYWDVVRITPQEKKT